MLKKYAALILCFSSLIVAMERPAQIKDYYSILGVDRAASLAVIKDRYKILARQYHPDKNKDASATVKFQELAEAYQVLSDEGRRRDYNRLFPEREARPYYGSPATGFAAAPEPRGFRVSPDFTSVGTAFFSKKEPSLEDAFKMFNACFENDEERNSYLGGFLKSLRQGAVRAKIAIPGVREEMRNSPLLKQVEPGVEIFEQLLTGFLGEGKANNKTGTLLLEEQPAAPVTISIHSEAHQSNQSLLRFCYEDEPVSYVLERDQQDFDQGELEDALIHEAEMLAQLDRDIQNVGRGLLPRLEYQEEKNENASPALNKSSVKTGSAVRFTLPAGPAVSSGQNTRAPEHGQATQGAPASQSGRTQQATSNGGSQSRISGTEVAKYMLLGSCLATILGYQWVSARDEPVEKIAKKKDTAKANDAMTEKTVEKASEIALDKSNEKVAANSLIGELIKAS